MGDLVKIKDRADKRRAEVQRLTTQREVGMLEYLKQIAFTLKPAAVLFLTTTGRKVFAAALRAAKRTAIEALLHQGWTDDDRRAYAIMAIKEELGTEFPAQASLINFAIEWVVRMSK